MAADGATQLEVPGKKRKKSEKPKPGMNETHHSAASGRRRGFGPKKDKEKEKIQQTKTNEDGNLYQSPFGR